MDSSPLRKLPPELRLCIYELALTYSDVIKFRYDCYRGGKTIFPDPLAPPHLLALTQTCLQIRNECGDLFFRLNAVNIKVMDAIVWVTNWRYEIPRVPAFTPLSDFGVTVGAENAAVVPSITIDLGQGGIQTLQISMEGKDGNGMWRLLKAFYAAAQQSPQRQHQITVCAVISIMEARVVRLAIDAREPLASSLKADAVFMRDIEVGGKWEGISASWASEFHGLLRNWSLAAERLEEAV
ncbi:hypothetical protein LTR85_008232 [Meristemomyces frigidus]|nr:hypothetical protein LTR85_008232 [Meristemomyces frigidus]